MTLALDARKCRFGRHKVRPENDLGLFNLMPSLTRLEDGSWKFYRVYGTT